MSQRTILTASGSTPSIPTSFQTDNGIAVPAANILNVLGTNGITTSGAGNTVTINLDDNLVATGSSVNAAPVDLFTIALGGSAAVYRFTFLVTGRDTATGDGVGYTVDASARTTGAAATIIATPFSDSDEDTSLLSALISVVASANNVILRATGVAGQTITYKATVKWVSV